MDSVLIVTNSNNDNEEILRLLKLWGTFNISSIKSNIEARTILLERDFDIVIISDIYLDEFSSELALLASKISRAGVIYLLKNEIDIHVAEKLENQGILIVYSPITKSNFNTAFKTALAMNRRLAEMELEVAKLRKNLEELKLISRAKCMLVQHLKIDEEKAHKYIEKHAMDYRLTRKEIATKIINHYKKK